MKDYLGRDITRTSHVCSARPSPSTGRALALACSIALALVASSSAAATEVFRQNPGALEQLTGQDDTRGAGPIRGDGIVVATGNKVELEQDFVVEEEMGLHLRRVYNHHWNGIGLFGKHWLSNFDYSLAFSTGIAWAQRPDGRRIKFFFDSTTNRWSEDKAQPIAYIVRNGDGTYTLHNEERGTETYNANGYIVQRRSEQGLVWTFSYSGNYLQRVTHTSGRSVQFVWTNGQVTQVIDPAGSTYQYTYTPNVFGTGRGRLATAVLPGAPVTTVAYHFEDARYPGGLTGKSFNGARYSTFAYDDQARAIRSEHAGAVERYAFAYTVESTQPVSVPPPSPAPGGYLNPDESGGCIYKNGTKYCHHSVSIGAASPLYSMASLVAVLGAASTTTQTPARMRVTETNPLGRQTVYVFEANRLISIQSGTKYSERTYDANGFINLVPDFESGIVDYDHDAHGHLLKKVEAVGSPEQRTTTYAWDEVNNRLLKETLVGQGETIYTYTANGRLETVVERNLSANGVASQARQTTYQYTYQSGSLLATRVVDGPVAGSADAVTYTYGSTGLLDRISNSLGHVETYASYTGLGRPGRVTGVNGNVTEYAYDARGRVTELRPVVAGAAQTSLSTYGGNGQVASVQTPDGHRRSFVYDAALRVIEEYEREAGGTYARKQYTYNAMSLPTSIQVVSTTYPYDTRVIGNIDSVSSDGAGGYKLLGWACSTGSNPSINVHVYLGGPAGTGQMSGSYAANQPSEAGVATACQASGTTYRFSIPITRTMQEQHGGKSIYVHGISPTGQNNHLIGGSGTLGVPVLPPPSSVPTLAAPAVNTTSSYTVSWNGVAGATAYALEESVSGTWAEVFRGGGTSVPFSGKSTAVAHLYRVRACNGPSCGAYSASATVQKIIHDAQYVSQSVPGYVAPGSTVPVSVTFKNTSNVAWTAQQLYRLGSQNPHDNTLWGLSRANLPGQVDPGATVTFQFNITAPSQATTQNFQWRMLREGVTWFGASSPNLAIQVGFEEQPPSCTPIYSCEEQ